MVESKEINAAVLVLYAGPPESGKLLFTQRGSSLRSHAGEIAFPGGRIEPVDRGATEAALREASEEVGLSPEDVSVVGLLSPGATARGVRVQPVVAQAREVLSLQPDGLEVESLRWIDIDFFRRDERKRTDVFRKGNWELWAPAYELDGYLIWGFTARVLLEFLRRYSGIELQREHAAPVRRYSL